jgi:serine protease Do
METTNTDSATGAPGPDDLRDFAADPVLANLQEFANSSNEGAAEHLLHVEQSSVTKPLGQGTYASSPNTSATWSPPRQASAPSVSSVPSPVPGASPIPPMTPWTAATPVPPTTMQWPTETAQAPSTPQGATYPQNPVASATSSSSAASTWSTSSSAPPPNDSNPTSPTKRGWVKPAFVGGLVGALTSGAILGGVLVGTRNSNNANRTDVTQTSSRAASPASSANTSPAGSTKVVPALASSTGQADVPRIVSELSKSIVTINTKGFPSADFFGSSQVPEGAGTGIVLTKDGFVLTNAHVIADAQTIKVTVPGGKTCQADVVGRDRANDVAVVKCRNTADFVPAALGKSSEMKVGEPVVAIGNALGLEGNPTVTTGILSATKRTLEGDGERLTGLLQTDAAINPGNSGGPLVNARGQVVGMNTAIYQNTNNIGFAIPIDAIVPIIEKIRSGEIGKPKTFLGVTTQTMDSGIQKQYSLGTDKGAIVVDVTLGSPAQNAGLQRGDIITKFDGLSITDNKQLGEQVRKHKAGDIVDMTYLRGSQSISTKVTLGSARSEI